MSQISKFVPVPRLIHGSKQYLPNTIVKSSKGSHVFSECGRVFVDFSSGIGVTNLGHCHDGVSTAVKLAVDTLVHAQQNIMKHRPMLDLIEKLSNLDFTKASQLDAWFFWNSGAEAVEAAVKLARQATARPNVIAFNLGYHGRTIGTMSLTTSGSIYRSGFSPLNSGSIFSPFPYLTQGPYGINGAHKAWLPTHDTVDGHAYWGSAPEAVAAQETQRCLDALELILRTQSAPSETAAILLEPVQGEGGYVPSPPGFLAGLREICDKHYILLIADEVQTGFGRTGTMFASEWIDGGVHPDILITAKGLANGYPLSAIATRTDIAAKQPLGSMGGTYGGNAISCAASLAVLNAFEAENILENIPARELIIRKRVMELMKKFPGLIREVRGKGLMIGLEFEPLPGKKAGETAYAIMTECHRRDLLVLACGPYDCIRFIPALNIDLDTLNKGLDVFAEAFAEVVQRKN